MDREEAKRRVIELALKHNRAKTSWGMWATLKTVLAIKNEMLDTVVGVLEIGSAGPIDWIRADGELIFERRV